MPSAATAPIPATWWSWVAFKCRAGRAACHGSASPLPPGVTALQQPQVFRELVTSLYVHSVSFRGLVRILDLLGCGVGAATLWRDVQAVAQGGYGWTRRCASCCGIS